MANRRVGGVLLLKVDGELFQAKGEFTYNINPVKRESVVGADTIHGFKEEPQVQFIEGAITDSDELDLQGFQAIRDATITLELANEKVIVLREAFYAADGDVTSSEGEIQARFEGIRGEEVR
jgi:hypothetical protein